MFFRYGRWCLRRPRYERIKYIFSSSSTILRYAICSPFSNYDVSPVVGVMHSIDSMSSFFYATTQCKQEGNYG